MSSNNRHQATGILADPAFRHERARKAAMARTSLDHHITKLIEAADRLSPGQRAELAALASAGAA